MSKYSLIVHGQEHSSIRRWLAGFALAATGIGLTTASFAAPGDGLSELKAAVTALHAQQSVAAAGRLRPLVTALPKLSDYAAWFLASAQFELQQYSDVPITLTAVWTQKPSSPLVARSALLAARAYVAAREPHAAITVLRKYYAQLPQPSGDSLLAAALAADGDPAGAAAYYQRVYYGYPLATEAARAEAEIARLKVDLGERYPPALGASHVSRAVKLLEASQAGRARNELAGMIDVLTGPERDAALVKLGVADYQLRRNAEAQRHLGTLTVADPESDAERLYYLVLCARRANNRNGMMDLARDLETRYPSSRWKQQALVAIADTYLVENNSGAYEPYYRACYGGLPRNSGSDACHWKVAMSHYLRREPDAVMLLREHLQTYPGSAESPAALYFLGQLAADDGDATSAGVFWSELVREYPNHYHATIAAQKLDSNASRGPSQAAAFLKTLAFPMRVRTRGFVPSPLANARLERARLLHAADLDEWAETELRHAAQTEDQPHVMAMELASISSQRGAPEQAIRYLKRYASDYLYLPLDSAPMEFWKLAFPLPYRSEIEKFARQYDLDPYFLAALIRQESEFDPKATSTASARGLTQIMPTTGRELSRRLQIRPYSTARLFQPAVNLQLGAFFLRSILDQLDGNREAALAAYNAGPSRAKTWLTWGEFRDPTEFVEAVPFSQTRNYIQVVLRNADLYRRIWGEDLKTADTVAIPLNRVAATREALGERKQSSRRASAR